MTRLLAILAVFAAFNVGQCRGVHAYRQEILQACEDQNGFRLGKYLFACFPRSVVAERHR